MRLNLPAVPGWRNVNGWNVLARALGHAPNMLQWNAVIDLDIPASVDFLHASAAVIGTVTLPQDSEFYVTHLSVAGYDTTTPGTFGLGGVLNSPEPWSALVEVYIERGGSRLTAAPCRVGHVFGDGSRPYRLAVPWILPAGATIAVRVTQHDTHAQRAFFTFHGVRRFLTDPPYPLDLFQTPRLIETFRRLRELGQLKRAEPFFYPINFEPAQGRVVFAVETGTFNVSDARFAVCHMMGSAEHPGTGVLIDPPDIAVRFNLMSGALRLDDRPVAFGSILGTARRPGLFPHPLLIEPGDVFTVLIAYNVAGDLGGGNTGAVDAFLTFPGVRIFPTVRK